MFRGKAINRDRKEHRTNYKDGEWVYGLIAKLYDERFPELPAEMSNENGITGIEIDYETIGEYTGLTDLNDTKIFEGDILKANNGHIGWVIFRNGEFVKRCCCCHLNSFNTIFYGDNETVVGNIYDNPELLKNEGA